MALSDFQQHLAAIISALPSAEGFALAGGSALAAHGLLTRHTKDLDYFGSPKDADAVQALAAAISEFGSPLIVSQVVRTSSQPPPALPPSVRAAISPSATDYFYRTPANGLINRCKNGNTANKGRPRIARMAIGTPTKRRPIAHLGSLVFGGETT